jgi:hypothetical protein
LLATPRGRILIALIAMCILAVLLPLLVAATLSIGAELQGCASIELDSCGIEPTPHGLARAALTVARWLMPLAGLLALGAGIAGVAAAFRGPGAGRLVAWWVIGTLPAVVSGLGAVVALAAVS